MGLFWDLIQHSQISEQREKTSDLQQRLESLEYEVHELRKLVQMLLQRLEEHFGEDIDRDGQVG